MPKPLLIVLLLACAPLYAHSDTPLQAEHGGTVKESAAGHQLELSYRPDSLTLYLKDHDGRPLKTSGANAEVILQTKQQQRRVTLTPSGSNQLSSQGDFATLSGSVAIIQYTLAGQKLEQARLTLQ